MSLAKALFDRYRAGLARRRKHSPRQRVALWLALVGLAGVVGCYLVWWGVFYHYQDEVLFPTQTMRAPKQAIRYTQAVDIRRPLDDGGYVQALFISSPEKTKTGPAPVVVYFHDGTQTIDFQDILVSTYWQMGFSVLLPEYRGYGRSSGKPSEELVREDMVYFYDAMIHRSDVDTHRILFHGRALGGAIAADLAAQRPPTAMILESTFESMSSMAYQYAAPALLVTNPYRTDQVVANYHHPLLIAHGADDDLIPIEQARELRKLADPGMLTYVELPCAHDDFPGRGNYGQYWNQVQSFLGQAGVMPVKLADQAPSSAGSPSSGSSTPVHAVAAVSH